ncbi:hypothetical protein ACFL35_03885 [Candidatus Riflebacteria bacterium]
MIKDTNEGEKKYSVHKFLISSPVNFTGRLTLDFLDITQSFFNFSDENLKFTSFSDSPFNRSYLLCSLKIEEEIVKNHGHVLTNPIFLAEFLCSSLAVFFGKKFSFHGFIESHGISYVPYGMEALAFKTFKYPFMNRAPRVDFQIPLALQEAEVFIYYLFMNLFKSCCVQSFQKAASFYLSALKEIESEPAKAYLSLITSGEILSGYFDYKDEDLFHEDDPIKNILRSLADNKWPAKEINCIRERLYQVRQKFWLTINKLLPENFFDISECQNEPGQFNKADFKKRIKSAYDLRSQYVHTGFDFGNTVYCLPGWLNEIHFCSNAPTFLGLERVIRVILLNFIHTEGIQLLPLFVKTSTKKEILKSIKPIGEGKVYGKKVVFITKTSWDKLQKAFKDDKVKSRE